MARSQEKAMSTLNRWVDQKHAVDSGLLNADRKSRLPSDCRSVKEAEAARSGIIRQLTTLIAQIQNAALGEQRIRDMNDQINRSIRSKYVWEIQIRKLGGPDYTSLGSRLGESEGVEVPGQSGYKYFGAAKDLPGVRQLLEQEPAFDSSRRTRKQLLHNIHADYYGWMDTKVSTLLADEADAEAVSTENLNEERKAKRETLNAAGLLRDTSTGADFDLTATGSMDTKDIEKLLLAKKKEMLFSRYIVCLFMYILFIIV